MLHDSPLHTTPIFDPVRRRVIVNKSIEMIRGYEKHAGIRFDAFVGCGFSGIPLATILCEHLGRSLICVRKESEKPVGDHRRINFYGVPTTCQYLIIEDVIESGNTIQHILDEMNRNRFECQGILLYNYKDTEFSNFYPNPYWSWDERATNWNWYEKETTDREPIPLLNLRAIQPFEYKPIYRL